MFFIMLIQLLRDLREVSFKMEKMTEKEKGCLLKYLEDLLEVMEQDHIFVISDGIASYTESELICLIKKIDISS